MAETRQELLSKLAKTRHELMESQARVTELEALLTQDQPNANAPLDSDSYDRKRALGETNSLAKFPEENPNPVLRIARDSTILCANPVSHRLLALWRCQVGTRLPDEFQHVVSDAFANKLNRDVDVICGDVHYSLTVVPSIETGYGNIYGQDITERKRSELSLKRYAQRMEILHELDTGIILATSTRTLVETALNHIRTLFSCQQAVLMLFDFTTNEAIIFAADLSAPIDIVAGSRYPIPVGYLEGFDMGQIVVINDRKLLPESSQSYQNMKKQGMQSSLRALLTFQGRPVGILGLSADTAGFFTAEHQEITTEIANQLTIAIRQRNQTEELARHTVEVERNNANLKQAEESLQRYAQRLEILHEIDLKIIRAGSLQSLLEIIVKHLRTLIPCPRVAAALIDQATGEAVIYAVDLNSPSAVGEGVRTSLPTDWFDGFDADNTRVIDNFRSLSDPLPTYKQLIEEGIVTSLHVLLMDREHPVGIFSLSAATPGFFTAEHRKIAAEIANQIAIGIRQLNLIEELARHAAELEQNNIDLKQAETGLQRYAQRMEMLHQIDLGIIHGGSIQTLTEVTLKHLRQLIPCQLANVTIIDETTDEAVILAVGLEGNTILGQGVRVPIPPNVFEGYDARHVRIFDDISLFQNTQPRAKRLVNEGLVSALSVLLMDQERPIGVLGLFADTSRFLPPSIRTLPLVLPTNWRLPFGNYLLLKNWHATLPNWNRRLSSVPPI